MNLKSTSASVVSAALLLALGAATAFAQAKPKSAKRIPITKEAAGEVAPRVDTITKYDTVTNTIYHTDTLVRTMVRVDSVMVPPPPRPIILPGGFYFGLAGGASAPDGALFTPNSVGFVGQSQLGWQDHRQVFGLRLSGTYTGMGEDTQFSRGVNAKLWTLSTDAKLGAPLGHVFGFTPRLNIYAIGGWTYTWFKDLPYRLNATDNSYIYAAGDPAWIGKSGWDAGGGLSLTWGHSEVFVESRVIGFSPTNAPEARQIPIVLGFNWY